MGSEHMKPETARPAKTRAAKAAPVGRHAAKKPAAAHVNKIVKSRKPASKSRPGSFGAKLSRRMRRIGAWLKRPRNPSNVKTALWLWCFPVGLSKMWRSSCTWRTGVKIGITVAMAAVLAAVFIVPIPKVSGSVNGVQIVSDKPEVEVYGPALPSLIVPGYTQQSTGSIIVDEMESDVHYVYAADGARCYHEYECKFAFASSQRLTVYEAYYLGFEPCGRCNPPVYTPGITDPITAEVMGATDSAAPAADETAAETAA